nr:Hypothetical protein [Aeromonas sp.]
MPPKCLPPQMLISGGPFRCNTPLPAKPSLMPRKAGPSAERVGPLAGSGFKAGVFVTLKFSRKA